MGRMAFLYTRGDVANYPPAMDFFLCADPGVGSITQIATAGAAVVAAATGLYGVVNAVRSYRASIDSQKLQAENDRRDQARFVHPTVEGFSYLKQGERLDPTHQVNPEIAEVESVNGPWVARRDSLTLWVELRNDSQEVISAVILGAENECLPVDRNQVSGDIDYLLPASKKTVGLVIPWARNEVPNLSDWIATVVFTDARGNLWTRETGRPVMNFADSDESAVH